MKKIILIFLSIILSLCLVEVLLRSISIKPWSYAEFNTPTIFNIDKSLGWRAKEGSHTIKNPNSDKKTSMTFGKKGNRINEYHNELNNPAVLFFGGSFTQGWGVNDKQTYVSKLQNEYKNFTFYNFAQAGFGGTQSLVMLREEINQIKDINLVVYGFIEHHEYRNVARSAWLETLAKYSRRGYSEIPKIPYASLNNENKLLINPPIGYLQLPLREYSSIVTLIEKFYMKQITKKRKRGQKIITKKIILEMDEISKKNNSKFLLVILDWSNEFTNDEYKKFMADQNISFVDCKILLNKETLIKGDYHPNEKGHSMYSTCIKNFINKNKLL